MKDLFIMNSKTNLILLIFTLFIAFLATSCRGESDELIQAPDNQSLKANSNVANLMLRISIGDGKSENDITNDEPIECIDFVYPFSVSAFDSQTELITTVSFENDDSLNLFLIDLNDNDVVNINFPVVLVLSDGLEISTNNLSELEEVIEIAINDDCDDDDDDDDDNDDDDDDNDDDDDDNDDDDDDNDDDDDDNDDDDDDNDDDDDDNDDDDDDNDDDDDDNDDDDDDDDDNDDDDDDDSDD